MITHSKLLQSRPEIVHGFTSRKYDFSPEKFIKDHELKEASYYGLKQIHSNICVTAPVSSSTTINQQIAEADALITNQKNVVLSTRSADCVTLLMYDPLKSVIAATHAGWRGIVAGVIESTIDQMCTRLGSQRGSIIAVMGPALCESCFEVGPEVVFEFRHKFRDQINILKGKGDRSHINLRGVCDFILKKEGVGAIETVPFCTSCNNDLFYSYRRGDKEGRLNACIVIK